MILPLPRTGPSQSLQVAVDDEDQVVEPLAPRQRQHAERLRLIALAIADERPDLAVAHGDQAAPVEVLHDVGLIDRLDRPEAHRYRGKLPIVRHQPRVRVGRESAAIHFPAKTVELLFRQAAFEKRARVDSGRAVALEVDQIPRMLVGRAAKEIVEADVIQGGRRSERGDVSTEIFIALVGAEHHGQGVPANERANAPLHEQVAGHERLLGGRDRVSIRRCQHVGQTLAGLRQPGRQAFHQQVRPVDPVLPDDRLQRVEPLLGLLGVDVLNVPRVFHRDPPGSARTPVCAHYISSLQALRENCKGPARTLHQTAGPAKNFNRAAGPRPVRRSHRPTPRA